MAIDSFIRLATLAIFVRCNMQAAYDKVLRAKQAARLRAEKMDAEHRKAREGESTAFEG